MSKKKLGIYAILYAIFIGLYLSACSLDNETKYKIKNPKLIDFAESPKQILDILNQYDDDEYYDAAMLNYHKARLYFELNDYQKGLDILKENSNKFDNHLPTLELLAKGYKQISDYSRAKYYYDLAIEKGIKKINIFKQKAQVDFTLKYYKSALNGIEYVLKEKYTPENLLFKAKVQLYSNDTINAIQTMKKIQNMGVKDNALNDLLNKLSDKNMPKK